MSKELATNTSCNSRGGSGREVLSADSANESYNSQSKHNSAHGEQRFFIVVADADVNYLSDGIGNKKLENGFKTFEQRRKDRPDPVSFEKLKQRFQLKYPQKT